MSDGWVKLSDPSTGKEFYANKLTRQTQWDAPAGFVDPAAQAQAQVQAQVQAQAPQQSTSDAFNNENANALPSNWEELKDEASGKYFYVDHVNKVTTWERPTNANATVHVNSNSNGSSSSTSIQSQSQSQSQRAQGTSTGFGFIPAAAKNGSTYGSSSRVPAAPTPKQTNVNSSTSASTSTAWGAAASASASSPYAYAPSSTSSSYEYSYKPSTNAIDDQSTKYYSKLLPQIDFNVVKVPDRLRSSCPSCPTIFSLSKRRHHCRLCGDVFCDACSSHRVLLPLGGAEFDKPVRVCNDCHVDVDKGNYFSMRRYLTPLLLFNGENEQELQKAFGKTNDDGSAVESIDVTNVAAALTSLTQDLEAVLLDSTSFSEKVTIPPDVLIPAITRHLALEETSDRAIKALSTLLSLGNVVGDNSFAATVFCHQNAKAVFENICKLLEWSGMGTKTLAVQEQAAKALFYLTDKRVVGDILEMEEANGHLFDEGWIHSAVMLCDAPRVLRSVLDHTTSTESPTLQRWSAACIRNLISEDERRGCEAVSEAMSMGYTELRYESFVTELVSSGGAMILSSLVASDDADTREHAMAALSQIIDAARNMNVRLGVFIEAFQITNIQTCSETAIIETVVSSGACGATLAQLLLSADNSSAAMACDFARSLVYPIISNPLGTSVPRYHRLFASNVDLAVDEDGLKEYRKAALNIGASDGVLGALVHLVTDVHGAGLRPVELRRSAMQILAAIAHTVAYWDSKIKNCGKPVETMDESILRLHEKVGIAVTIFEEERAAEAVMASFSSASINSLNTSRDSPSSQLKEASALTICALSSCSLSMANVFMSSNVLGSLISICADDGFNTPSRRGAWSSRRLPMLEAVATILVQGWKMMQRDVATRMLEEGSGSGSSSRSLELLLEALDGGIVPLISRILNSAQEFSPSEKAYADTRTKIAVCHCVSAMFGIGRGDATNIGFARIFEAMGNRHRIISQILFLLGSIVPEAQKNASQGRSIEKDIPLLQLLEANLLAAGSICGSEFCSFGSMDFHGDYDISPGLGATGNDVFSTQFQEICSSTSDIINKNSFVPSALVGVFGEGAAMPILRLVSVVAENGSTKHVHQQLVRSGVLLPLTDMLRDAMNAGDYYIFDACVATIGHAGPQMNSSSENNSICALRDCVKLFASVLLIEDRSGGASDSKKLDSLKMKCIKAVEMLSSNSSLWTVIVAHFVPPFMDKWLSADRLTDINPHTRSLVCAGLHTILRVISLPTHAVFIANTGIAASLSNIICSHGHSLEVDGGRVEELCIQILHVLLSYSGKKGPPTERIDPGVVDIYALDVACSLLSRDTHVDPNVGMTNTKLGLEIVLEMISGLEDIGQVEMPQSPRIIGFVETMSSNKIFLKRLCATLLSFDPNESQLFELQTSVRSIYGKPIFLFEGPCGPFMKSADAAIHILFWVAFYASVAHSQNSNILWETLMLDDEDISDQSSKYLATCAASANFLGILSSNGSVCLPINQAKLQFFKQTAQPVVQERLLHMLSVGTSGFWQESENETENDSSFQKLLSHYRAPQLCLELSSNSLLLEQSFSALQNCLSSFPRSLLDDIVSEKVSLASLFSLLALSENVEGIDTEKIGAIRVFAAAVLSSAGELNVLGPAVNRMGLRGFAVASLSAACLTDDSQSATLAEDLTEEGSSMSMLCLHGLVDVLSSDSRKDGDIKIMLSPSEAQAISAGLAKKLSSMVLERFMNKAEREHVLGEIPGEDAIQRFPEVTLLCALASSKEALTELCDNGGLEALSLVAGEGELSAIAALLEVCSVDPKLVINVDAHVSALQVISKDSSVVSPAAKKGCFELLVQISSRTRQGRDAISNAEECSACIEYASDLIKGLAQQTDEENKGSKETKEENGSTTVSVELESISFLSSLVPNENCRDIVLMDEELEASIESLAKNSQSYDVQQAAILYLGSCARFIKYDGEDAQHYAEGMSSSLLSILDSSQVRRKSRQIATSSGRTSFGDFSKTHQTNENLILASTCKVLEALMPNMSFESVSKVLQSISIIWSDTLNFHMLSSKKTASEMRNSGVVMFNMSALLLLTMGRKETQELMNSSATVTNLLRFALLDPDKVEKKSKQSGLGDSSSCDMRHWQAALSQSLQCLATLTTNSNFKSDDGKCWDLLVSDVETNTTSKQASKIRSFGFTPQAAPPSQTLIGSLDRHVTNITDPICSIVASRVKENLFG